MADAFERLGLGNDLRNAMEMFHVMYGMFIYLHLGDVWGVSKYASYMEHLGLKFQMAPKTHGFERGFSSAMGNCVALSMIGFAMINVNMLTSCLDQHHDHLHV